MTPLVFDVLLKFRLRHIGITTDIEKAFHQIISPDDHDMLRLLWVDDISSREVQVVQYRFCRLVFGLTPVKLFCKVLFNTTYPDKRTVMEK